MVETKLKIDFFVEKNKRKATFFALSLHTNLLPKGHFCSPDVFLGKAAKGQGKTCIFTLPFKKSGLGLF
jgi:hypothetical protein